MYNDGSEEIKGIISDFKMLATKIQQDNGQVKKALKEREGVLQACKKEDQKLYYENEALKERCEELKQKVRESQQQQKQRQKPRRSLPKIIESKKPRKRYNVMPDEDSEDSGNAADNEATESESEEEDEIRFVKVPKKKKTAETEAKRKKKTQKGIVDFINS